MKGKKVNWGMILTILTIVTALPSFATGLGWIFTSVSWNRTFMLVGFWLCAASLLALIVWFIDGKIREKRVNSEVHIMTELLNMMNNMHQYLEKDIEAINDRLTKLEKQ